MASMRDIKRRKGSIQSTQQITKAMNQRAGRTDRSLFSVYVPDGKFHFSTQRQYGSSILKKRGIQKESDRCTDFESWTCRRI